MTITINPGTGPVEGATLEHAKANMDAFAADLRERGMHVTGLTRREDADDDGRYGYLLTMGDARKIEIDMPGLPLDRVRYMDTEGQDIWDFPRLYVDGSSWIWMFALGQCEPDDCGADSAASADEPPQPPRGDQILADTTLSDTEAFAAAGEAYAADSAASADQGNVEWEVVRDESLAAMSPTERAEYDAAAIEAESLLQLAETNAQVIPDPTGVGNPDSACCGNPDCGC